MKIILTGSNGLLGSSIKNILIERGHICFPYSINRQGIDWNIDLRNNVLNSNSEVLIHAAANTDVEACERDPLACFNDNTLTTELVAKLAFELGLKLVFISSTGVYGNYKNTPYSENDECHPTTIHHKSKRISEELITSLSISNLIIRTGWLYGGSMNVKKNFVAQRIIEAKNKEIIFSNIEQFGNPCFNDDIALRIVEMIENESMGIFNCVNDKVASRFDYVRAIIECTGLKTKVLPATADKFIRSAPVSNNEAAVNLRAEKLNYFPLPDWSVSLSKYIDSLLS